MSDRRKREIRELMAETGMNYTRAARELERRKSGAVPRVTGSIEFSPAIAAIQRGAEEYARQVVVLGGPSKVGEQLAAIQRAVDSINMFKVRFTPPV